MRLWEKQQDPEEEAQQPPVPASPQVKTNPLEKAILNALASNPQFREAIQGLLGMVQEYNAVAAESLAILRRMERRQAADLMRQQGPTHIPIEGVVADGLKCPICNSEAACDCFTKTEKTDGE